MASSRNRPYFNLSANQLCEEIETKLAESNTEDLIAIKEEISKRTRSRRKLDIANQKINEYLNQIQINPNPADNKQIQIQTNNQEIG